MYVKGALSSIEKSDTFKNVLSILLTIGNFLSGKQVSGKPAACVIYSGYVIQTRESCGLPGLTCSSVKKSEKEADGF